MVYLLITVLGIALCSLIGAAAGFLLEDIPPRLDDTLTGGAAGIMLCAAITGLIVPSTEFSGDCSVWLPSVGVLCGAAFLTLIGGAGQRLGAGLGMSAGDAGFREKTLTFVAAIAIHHFPEGIAAGVSFGTGDPSDALTVTSGIAFQNIPEAMILIPPLLKAGTGKRRAAAVAAVSGLVEIVGVLFGYYAVKLSTELLPFALSFAGGTMLYVVTDDMIPQTHSGGSGRLATYSALIGFCLMLVLGELTA